MESIKIDKHVPMPVNSGNSGKRKYPFLQLEVGDSFEVLDSEILPGSIRNCAFTAGKGTTLKFATRKTENGMRVWRVK